MLRFKPDGTTESVSGPFVFPTKTDPVTGELTAPTLPQRVLPQRIFNLIPLEASIPEAPAPDEAAAAGGYTLSDLAAGAGAPTVGAPADKSGLKTLDTGVDLTTTTTTTDNTALYIGLAVAAAGALYLYSQTAAGKAAFKK